MDVLAVAEGSDLRLENLKLLSSNLLQHEAELLSERQPGTATDRHRGTGGDGIHTSFFHQSTHVESMQFPVCCAT